METLKFNLEAVNAFKRLPVRMNDSSFDMCFDKIISYVFEDKRGLIKYLLTPHHKLSKFEMIQIKDIFNDEHKRLMKTKNAESGNDADDIEEERIIPTVTNISEHVQIYITSFLDYATMKNLRVVCSSIAPIALDQFSKMDVEICNLHQMKNGNHYMKSTDIVESNTKTYRVRLSDNVKTFVEKELNIAPGNVLIFDRDHLQISPKSVASTFGKFAACNDNINKFNTYSMTFGDKTKMYEIKKPTTRRFNSIYQWFLIQEFDVKEQRLKFKQFASRHLYMDVLDIQNLVVCNTNETISLFHFYDRVTEEDDSDLDQLDDTSYEFGWEQLSQDDSLRLYDVKRSGIYQIETSKEDLAKIEKKFHQKLEPFYSDVTKYYESFVAEKEKPGTKYALLAQRLEEEKFDKTEIAKCYKKAYELNSTDSLFIYNYIVALMESENIGSAEKMCAEKIELHHKGTIDICQHFFEIYEIYERIIDNKHKKADSDHDEDGSIVNENEFWSLDTEHAEFFEDMMMRLPRQIDLTLTDNDDLDNDDC